MNDLEEADRRVVTEVCLPAGCRRPSGGVCPAINHPSEIWLAGSCWALTRDRDWQLKLVRSLMAYTGRPVGEVRRIHFGGRKG